MLGNCVMPLFAKATSIGLLTGLLGLMLSFLPLGIDLEENFGLDLLFHLRGKREPPSNVIIVALDNFSAKTLDLPIQPLKWPRSLHARLTEYLAQEGARVIAFDINFSEPMIPETDHLFARAIQKAGNVVLCENLQSEAIVLAGEKGAPPGHLNIEKLIPPVEILARSAAALAPFPLPKVPVKVNQYWVFKTSAGDMPTLPVVVLQLFALVVHHEFIALLEKANSALPPDLPYAKNAAMKEKKVKTLIQTFRNIFRENQSIADQMLAQLSCMKSDSSVTSRCQLLKALIGMYQSPDSRYLNFYGPPGSIPTVSYCSVLTQMENQEMKTIDFREKAVFVGYSEQVNPTYKDGFYTSYSQASGVDISGVEMTATAFANLIEDSPIHPFPLARHVAFILFWGFLAGLVFYLFPIPFSLLGVMGISLICFAFVQYQFNTHGTWIPFVVPIFVESPTAFFGAVLWKYGETKKERENIRNAFGYYLPNNVIDKLVKNIARKKTDTQMVYGTCLCTDAGRYTSLSETMSPKELAQVMNRYYQTLFMPVRANGGIVINIVGDSMLALWAETYPNPSLRKNACGAALEIAKAVARFNGSIGNIQLPTRIGLHHGQVSLGNIGAMDHYEYRPTGDIVNTASRMEGLNKYLGTGVLVSEEVIIDLEGFLARHMGQFLLSGKSVAVGVWELICPMEESTDQQRAVCRIFSQALKAYQAQSWDEAMNLYFQVLGIKNQDGPSLFYLNLIEKYRNTPPGPFWEGVVRMEKK